MGLPGFGPGVVSARGLNSEIVIIVDRFAVASLNMWNQRISVLTIGKCVLRYLDKNITIISAPMDVIRIFAMVKKRRRNLWLVDQVVWRTFGFFLNLK